MCVAQRTHQTIPITILFSHSIDLTPVVVNGLLVIMCLCLPVEWVVSILSGECNDGDVNSRRISTCRCKVKYNMDQVATIGASLPVFTMGAPSVRRDVLPIVHFLLHVLSNLQSSVQHKRQRYNVTTSQTQCDSTLPSSPCRATPLRCWPWPSPRAPRRFARLTIPRPRRPSRRTRRRSRLRRTGRRCAR